MKEIFLKNIQETLDCGSQFASSLKPGDVVCLDGTLGSGKTTFTKGVAVGLGITEIVTSPTFSIINVYPANLNLYHMDLYRLSGPEEFELIGGVEYLDGDGVCIIEWSDKIHELLPSHTQFIQLSLKDNGRKITFLNQ